MLPIEIWLKQVVILDFKKTNERPPVGPPSSYLGIPFSNFDLQSFRGCFQHYHRGIARLIWESAD